MLNNKHVLIIAGPTGVGESTVTAEIIKRHPNFSRLITATSRPPREKEKNGIDYFFFTPDEFRKKIEQNLILEYQNIRQLDCYYGTYKPELEGKIKAGRQLIINTDIVGARYYRDNYNATTIFLMPGSLSDLKKRLLTRNPSIGKEELAQRLKYAKYEIKKESPFYDYIVYNKQDKLDETIKEIEGILIKEKYIS